MKYAVAVIITVIIAGVIGYLGMEYISVEKARAKSEAVDGCMNIARYTFENEGGITSLEIVNNYFTKCMEAKNVQ